MKQTLEHWKEAVGVALYFGFLAYFTPKARALGWGIEGTMFCVLAGAVVIGLLYLLVKGISQYIEDHREEVESYREYMGLGSSTPHVELATLGSEHTDAELDSMLATNPYASVELFSDDKYTRLLPSADTDEEEETRLVDEPEDDLPAPGGKIAAIIGDNPRRRLDMADNFQPDANRLAATGMLACGMPGSGKTNVLMRFAEQYIKRFYLPCVVFDSQGDGSSLLDICPNGHVAVPGRIPSMQSVITYSLQVVFDLSEWHKSGVVGMDPEMAAILMTQAIRDVMAAQKAIEPARRRTCLVVIDELQLWVPQSRTPGGMQKTTASELYSAVMALATTGRKLGLMPLFAATRIAMVHNDAIASAETRILGKVDLDTDIDRYREYVSKGVISDEQLRALGPGEMVVCHAGKRLLTQFYRRDTEHASHTPSVTQDLDKFRHKLPPEMIELLTRPVEAAPPRPTPIPPYVPRQQSTQVESLVPAREPVTRAAPVENATRQPLQFPRSERRGRMVGLADELRAALEVYQPGMTYRDLGRALGCSDAEARILWQELKQRSLLHTPGETEQEAARPEIPSVPQKSSNKADLETALQAYDQGNKTIDALAVALGMTPWTVRTLYAQVRKLRKNAG